MSMKKLAVACALACGTLIAGGAQAYDVDLFLSGASAVQSNFVNQLPALMVAGYTTACDNTSTNCANFFAVEGTFKSAAPVPSSLYGKTVRITYRTQGGSVWGVNPLATATPMQWMDMDSAVAGACATAPVGYTFGVNKLCAPTGNDDGSANAYGPARVSDLGVSDVEPKMFTGINLEYDPATHASRTALSPADLAALTNFPAFQNAFAIPMTNVIPHDMTTSDPTLNLFLDKPTLLGMLSNNAPQLHDWSGVANAPLAAINPGAGASNGTNKPVVVCRRVQGSGTQATTNYFLNNFGCSGTAYVTPSRMTESNGFDATTIYVANTVTSTAANPIIIDPSYGYTVIENPASGDVRSCLADAQSGTNWAFKGDDGNYYQVTFSGAATGTTTAYSNTGNTAINAPFGAVGVLSYDSAGKENGWHFHDLNGLQTATKAAIDASSRPATSTAKYATALMIEGPWDFFSEESMQYRNGANGKPALADAPLGAPAGSSLSKGPVLTLSNALIKIVGDPTKVNGNLGIAALPTNYAPTGNVTTNTVSKGTKSGNTCNPKSSLYKAQFWK